MCKSKVSLHPVFVTAHPNYKAIVIHGGWSTVLESLLYEKPMILVPLFADHFKNAKVIEEKGLGVTVDTTQINNGKFANALGEVLSNNRSF
jgi:glucuronosyltransferase